MKIQLHLLLALIFIIFSSNVFPQVDLDSGLVAYYPLNGNANDESGNGYNGTVSGATLTSDRFNQADKAYNFIFNGFSSDKIQVSGTSGLNFSSGGFSLSAWIKFSGSAGSGNNYPIVSKHICGEQSGFILMLYNGKLTFWLAGSAGYNNLSTNEDYTDEIWHQVVAVYDDVNQYIYVDGLLKNSIPFDYSVINSADWAIGGYNGCNGGFNGKVDEVKIYNRPLSASEILDNYNLTRNSLVAYLPFNGNTIDISGNGHDGTINGNATLTPDRFNAPDRAYTFPDQSSNIELANSVSLNLETGFTINAWIKYKSGRQRVIIDKHVCGYPNGFAFVIDWNDQIAFYLASSGWSIVETNDTFFDDQWYMVTATYDAGTGITNVYVDGELGGSGSATYNNFSPYPITVGESYQNNCGPGNMDGAVDEIKIYNRVLSDAEIETEYNSSREGLSAYWPFDGNVTDISGNLNHGINYGGTFEYDRYGVSQSSIHFDGLSSYIEGINPGNNLPIGDSPRTFSCWIKSSEAPSSRNIFHYGTAEIAPTNYHLFLQEGKYVGIGNGYGFGILISNKDIGDGTWHFITSVYKGSSTNLQHIYINGKLDTSAVISSTPNTVLINNWKMGQFLGGSQSLLGNVDDLKIFNNALNDQEILSLYQSSTTAPLLIYPANDSTINTLTPLIDWDSTVTVTYYRLLVSVDTTFTSIIADQNLYSSSYQVQSGLLQENIEYFWKVRTVNDGGVGPWSEVFNFNIIISDVEAEMQSPTKFALIQNYPNPFNPSTSIQYQLSSISNVSLKVYDVLGNEVATLVNEEKPAGSYEVEFNAAGLSSGMYFYQLKAVDPETSSGQGFVETKKMLLLK